MEPSAALLNAIQENDAAQVAETLERYPGLKGNLDGPLPGYAFGGTALLAAVYKRNREMIDALLRAGADINRAATGGRAVSASWITRAGSKIS